MNILKNIENDNNKEGFKLKYYSVSFEPTILYQHYFHQLFNDNYINNINIVVTNNVSQWEGITVNNKYGLLNLQFNNESNTIIIQNKKINIDFEKIELLDIVLNYIPNINRIIFDNTKYKYIRNVNHIWVINKTSKIVKIVESYNLGVPQIYETNIKHNIIKNNPLDILLIIRNKISIKDFNNSRKECYICEKIFIDMGLILCCNNSSVCVNCFKEYIKCPICRVNLKIDDTIIFFKTGLYIQNNNLYDIFKSSITNLSTNYKNICEKYNNENNKLGDKAYKNKVMIYSKTPLPYIPYLESNIFQINKIPESKYNNISHLLIYNNIIKNDLNKLVGSCQVEGRTNDLQVIVNGRIT